VSKEGQTRRVSGTEATAAPGASSTDPPLTLYETHKTRGKKSYHCSKERADLMDFDKVLINAYAVGSCTVAIVALRV
jgi:hypothetical protein